MIRQRVKIGGFFMFCSKCGKEISDNAMICTNCGCATENFQQKETQHDFYSDVSSVKTLGFISIAAAFLIPLVALVCGGLGIYKSSSIPVNTKGLDEAKKLNIIGIAAGAVISVVAGFIIFFCFIF